MSTIKHQLIYICEKHNVNKHFESGKVTGPDNKIRMQLLKI